MEMTEHYKQSQPMTKDKLTLPVQELTMTGGASATACDAAFSTAGAVMALAFATCLERDL